MDGLLVGEKFVQVVSNCARALGKAMNKVNRQTSDRIEPRVAILRSRFLLVVLIVAATGLIRGIREKEIFSMANSFFHMYVFGQTKSPIM
jgi:hypothetical protein